MHVYTCIYICKQHPSGDHRLMVRVKGDSNAFNTKKKLLLPNVCFSTLRWHILKFLEMLAVTMLFLFVKQH